MKIRCLIFILLYVSSLQSAKSQEGSHPNEKSKYFFAIVVSDIDKSINWYNNILEFSLLNKREVESIGLKQANLNRGNVHLEIIQLESAIEPKEVISEFGQKSKLIGLFKVGFSIPDFNLFISRLSKIDTNASGNVVNDPNSNERMIIIRDPDGNRIQIFEE